MEIGLCMTVRNERENLVACLEPIVDLFARVIIIDTGSSDGTPQLLRSRFGIEPLAGRLEEEACLALSPLRNQGFAQLGTPWILTLDADERIARDELSALVRQADRDLPAGLFCGWHTFQADDRPPVEDYKLCLFRASHRHHGLVHDTAQPSLRLAGERADWTDRLRILHFPNPDRLGAKRERYARRLACARRREPGWARYDWFLGHGYYKDGRTPEAIEVLGGLHRQRPPLFPVESLNASMLLAGLHAALGQGPACAGVLREALAYHAQVADDFEVRVNFRLRPWLAQALAHAAAGELAAIRPYPFPY